MARLGPKKPVAAKPPLGGEAIPPPGRNPALRRGCNMAAAAIAVVMFIVVCSLSGNDVTWPMDHFSDMHVLMSGENFAKHGFFRLRFLPVLYVGGIGEQPDYYTHYPPLPNLVNGLMQSVGIGIENLTVMRIFCGSLFIAGLVFMYLGFASVIGPLAAVVGLGFAGTTGYFFSYSICLHQHCYNVLFMGLFFYLFLRAVHSDSAPRWVWATCWVALMLESLASFDFILYPQIFAWLYVLATGRIRRYWRALLLLAAAPLAGQALHMLQNIWAVGWDQTMKDSMGYGLYTQKSRWETWGDAWNAGIGHSQALYYWPWPLVLVMGVVWLGLDGRREEEAPAPSRWKGALLLGVGVAGVGWSVAMPAHTGSHPHTASQFFPLVFLVMGGVGAMLIQWLRQRETGASMRVLAVAAGLVLIVAQIQNINRVTEQRGTLPSVMLAEAIGKDALEPNVGVLSNIDGEAQFAFFIRRPAWRCPNWLRNPFPQAIPTLQAHLPADWKLKYYVFIGRGNRQPFETLARNCQGRMAIPLAPDAKPELLQAYVQQGYYAILFDISPLHPGYNGPPLDPAVQEKQLRGEFARWDLPGFLDRWHKVLDRQPKPKE